MTLSKLMLLIIGIIGAAVGINGLITGKVYCKGGPYYRSTQPIGYWGSILVYFLWSLLMGYFVFIN